LYNLEWKLYRSPYRPGRYDSNPEVAVKVKGVFIPYVTNYIKKWFT